MTIDNLPTLNAIMNASSAVLATAAFVLIRTGRWRAHAAAMLAAVGCSVAFLAGYLTLHANRPPRSFGVHGPVIRPVYFTILGTHTVLAAVIVPLIALMLLWALRRRWAKHRRLGRWALPLWLYVSATGVVIYWMLYRL